MDVRRKSIGYSPFDEPFGIGGEGMLTVTGAALIRERMLSERSEFFLSLIAFSRIAGLLLYLMPCNRSRKHPLPARPGYVSQSTVSD